MEIYEIQRDGIIGSKLEKFLKNKDLKYWFMVTAEELIGIKDHFSFNNSTINECMDYKQQGRLEVYDNYSFGVVNIIDNKNGRISSWELNFFLSKEYIILVSKNNKSLVQVKNNAMNYMKNQSKHALSPEIVLYSILNNIVVSYTNLINSLETKLYKIEVELFEVDKKDFIKDIMDIRKNVMIMKKICESLLDVSEDLVDNENNILEQSSLRHFRNLVRKANRINMDILTIREYLTQVREAYQAQVDIKLNNIMKFFTVISAIFLPLTFLVGWYGMNFKYMPELEWKYGYSFVMILTVILVMVCIVYFKNKKYM